MRTKALVPPCRLAEVEQALTEFRVTWEQNSPH